MLSCGKVSIPAVFLMYISIIQLYDNESAVKILLPLVADFFERGKRDCGIGRMGVFWVELYCLKEEGSNVCF